MEAIKNALGFGGSTTESGQEPVSGETGPGTVEQPYDAGNAQGESTKQQSSVHLKYHESFLKCGFKFLDDVMQDNPARQRMKAWTARQQA